MVKGTDANRIGEKRLVAAGVITAEQMKKAVIMTAILTFIIALLLIYIAFGKEEFCLKFDIYLIRNRFLLEQQSNTQLEKALMVTVVLGMYLYLFSSDWFL